MRNKMKSEKKKVVKGKEKKEKMKNGSKIKEKKRISTKVGESNKKRSKEICNETDKVIIPEKNKDKIEQKKLDTKIAELNEMQIVTKLLDDIDNYLQNYVKENKEVTSDNILDALLIKLKQIAFANTKECHPYQVVVRIIRSICWNVEDNFNLIKNYVSENNEKKKEEKDV